MPAPFITLTEIFLAGVFFTQRPRPFAVHCTISNVHRMVTEEMRNNIFFVFHILNHPTLLTLIGRFFDLPHYSRKNVRASVFFGLLFMQVSPHLVYAASFWRKKKLASSWSNNRLGWPIFPHFYTCFSGKPCLLRAWESTLKISLWDLIH